MFDIILDQRKAVLAIVVLIGYTLYLVGLVIYRLYLSPIAKFPGPKLAAATYLYEGYYDLVKMGKYTFKIRDLHSEYGGQTGLSNQLQSQSTMAKSQFSRTNHSNQPF